MKRISAVPRLESLRQDTRPRASRAAHTLRSVVVPLDGSAAAESCLPHAVALARRTGASLRLVQVRPPDAPAETELLAIDAGGRLAFQTRSSAYLASVADRIADEAGLRAATESIAHDRVAEALEAACTSRDLLIVARPQRRAWSQYSAWSWGAGSVADRLINRLRRPLLIVPSAAAASPVTAERKLQRVLLPLVVSASAGQVIDRARTVVGDDLAEYWLFSVIPLWSLAQVQRSGGGGLGPRSDAARLRAAAWSRLDEARRKLEREDCVVHARLVFDNLPPGRAILSHASVLRADLIVLAGRPQWLPGWLHHAVPQYVARHAAVPVLLCPAEG